MSNNCSVDTATVVRELRENGIFASTTRGTSMEPLFRTGRDVIIVKRPEGELRRHDVALYRYPSGKFVLHRVLYVRKDEYIIRGDNTFALEHIPKDWVIGVLVKFNRKGKSHTVDERGYRLYVVLWRLIYPVRFVYHYARRAAGKIYRALFKRKRGESNGNK